MSRAEIRHTLRIAHLLRKCLILTSAAYCKILALRFLCGRFVAVAWNLKLVVDALCEFSCKLGTFSQGDPGDRNKRKNISSSRTGVSTLVLSHVNEFSGTSHTLERSLHDCFRTADKGHDCSVGCFARIHIQDLYST